MWVSISVVFFECCGYHRDLHLSIRRQRQMCIRDRLLNKAGLTVAEVPVKMRHRGDGKSRVFSSWWVVFKYMVQTTTLCIAKIGTRKTAL